MKRYVKVGTALLSCLTIMGSNIHVLAEELTPEQQYINESLAALGVNSPFYDTSFLEKTDDDKYVDGMIAWKLKVESPEFMDQLQVSEYLELSDPFWKYCLLNNYKNTAYAEAQASTGVMNCMQTEMDYGVKLDGSNMIMGCGNYETIGITQEEIDALPLYPVTDSWKPVNLVMTDEFYQYTEKVSDLIWNHKGSYKGIRRKSGSDLVLVQAADGGVSVGLLADAYTNQVYTGSTWTDAVTRCMITMKYSYATEESYYSGWESFAFYALPANTNWSSQQWRLVFYGIPNEMDWKVIHSILNAITPDAEVIYQALRTEWSDPLGYGPWKYWDKWYDIGEQSRIRTWRHLVSSETSDSYITLENGPQLTRYYYDIAPRDNGATVNLSGLDLVKEQRYGAKFY